MYAIIGAGPMGLACARNLQKLDLPFVGFEQHHDVGGLWDIDNPHSTMYESAHLISSKRMTEFAEFPMADSVAYYPHHTELKRYFSDFVAHFDLTRHYEFNTRVTAVHPENGGWRVHTRCGDVAQSRLFDGVLIANGTLHTPHQPPLPGTFTGERVHSAEYRHASLFRDKRVLIIGCGNSGADIAVDAVHQARSVDLSVRRGYYFIPKFLKGKPIDTIGGKLQLPRPIKQRLDALLIKSVVGTPSDYGLPDPDYKLYESHPVVNSTLLNHLGHGDITPRPDLASVDGHTVTFQDGRQSEYDLILQATGYQLNYPFIDNRHLNWPDEADAPRLYLNIFHPEHANLFVLGMIEAAGLGWEGRNQQARLVARYLLEKQRNSSAAQKLDQLRAEKAGEAIDGGYNYIKLARMAYYVNKQAYLSEIAKHIRMLERP